MGEVFRGTDELLGRPVAVKLLLPSDRDPQAAERFHREARAAAMLNDPHLVAVYDFGTHDDGFFLVMELVEGGTVADELTRHGSLPKDRAIDIVEQSAAGLAAAHRQDVVHRDVKPGNLLLAADGTVKVADFGIAHLPDGANELTATGQIIGSSHYLAPERASGGQAGTASDVYSLGCVLYQLVTGRPVFTAEHPTAILYQHVDATPTPPSADRPELAGPFEAVLLQMLAKDAADRPTAAEIAAGALRRSRAGGAAGGAFAALAGSTGTGATTPLAGGAAAPDADGVAAASGATPPGEAAASAVDGPTPTSPLTAPQDAGRTRKTALLAGGVAVLATAGAVAAVLLSNNGEKLPATTDVGPQPGTSQSTPTSGTETSPATGPTQSGAGNQEPQTTSTQPSQSPTQQGTPSPSPSGTPSTATPPTSAPTRATPSPSRPSQSTPTPSVPTGGTTSSPPPSSSTPPPSSPPTSAPTTGTPSPDKEGNTAPPPTD